MGARLVKLLGVLLILSAFAVALSRAPDRPVDTLVARWAPPPSEFIDLGGQLVHLRDVGPRGDPAPIVLLHGTGSSLHAWEGWVQALARHRRVITLDLPGSGLTGPWDGPRAGSDYRGDTLARFVIDLLDHLQVARAVIGGHERGGEVAWRLALQAPTRVLSLVLVAATGTQVGAEVVPLPWLIARTPPLDRVGRYLMPRELVAQGLAVAWADPSRIGTERVERHWELLLREGNREALGRMLRDDGSDIDESRLAAIAVPTLVLWGGRDRVVPPAAAAVFEARIRGSRVVRFDALGHVPHEEDPAATSGEVRRFLALDMPRAEAGHGDARATGAAQPSRTASTSE